MGSFLDELKPVDVVSTGDVKEFTPLWRSECYFAISSNTKEALISPIGIVQKLPVSGNLEVTFKKKDGRFLDFFLDTNTGLMPGMEVSIDDLIGKYLVRGNSKIARFLHKQDINFE